MARKLIAPLVMTATFVKAANTKKSTPPYVLRARTRHRLHRSTNNAFAAHAETATFAKAARTDKRTIPYVLRARTRHRLLRQLRTAIAAHAEPTSIAKAARTETIMKYVETAKNYLVQAPHLQALA